MSYSRGLIHYIDDPKYFLSAFKTHLAWPVQMKPFIDDIEYVLSTLGTHAIRTFSWHGCALTCLLALQRRDAILHIPSTALLQTHAREVWPYIAWDSFLMWSCKPTAHSQCIKLKVLNHKLPNLAMFAMSQSGTHGKQSGGAYVHVNCTVLQQGSNSGKPSLIFDYLFLGTTLLKVFRAGF